MTVYKLAVMGGAGVGKSALTNRFLKRGFQEDYGETIEDGYNVRLAVDGKDMKLSIVDTSGDDKYSYMRSKWVKDADGFMLVYDCTSRESFLQVVELYPWIVQVRVKGSVPIVLVANKCFQRDKEVPHSEGEAVAEQWACPFFHTSAKFDVGSASPKKCFVQLVRETSSMVQPVGVADSAAGSAGVRRGSAALWWKRGTHQARRGRARKERKGPPEGSARKVQSGQEGRRKKEEAEGSAFRGLNLRLGTQH